MLALDLFQRPYTPNIRDSRHVKANRSQTCRFQQSYGSAFFVLTSVHKNVSFKSTNEPKPDIAQIVALQGGGALGLGPLFSGTQ